LSILPLVRRLAAARARLPASPAHCDQGSHGFSWSTLTLGYAAMPHSLAIACDPIRHGSGENIWQSSKSC